MQCVDSMQRGNPDVTKGVRKYASGIMSDIDGIQITYHISILVFHDKLKVGFTFGNIC